MRRRALGAAAALAAAVAAACAVPLEGAPCHTDAQCPGGQLCTAAGRCAAGVPPSSPPVVTEVAARCEPAGCPRDAVVTVSARIDGARLATTEAWLVVEPGTDHAITTARVPLAPGAEPGRFAAELRLADVALGPATEPRVEPHVAVSDLAGNAVADAPGAAVEATRVRFAPLDLGEPVTPATVDAAGVVLLAGASGAAVAVTPDAAGGAPTVRKVPLGLAAMAAPTAGGAGAWFTSPSSLAAALLSSDGTARAVTCPKAGSASGLLRATAPLDGGWAFASAAAGQAYALSAAGCTASAVGVPLTTPFLAAGGKLFAATVASGSAALARFTPNTATGAVARDGWSPQLRGGAYGCDGVAAPLALDGLGHLAVLCRNGQLWCVPTDDEGDDDNGAVYLHTFAGAPSGVPVAAAGLDVLLAAGGALHRYGLLTTRDRVFTPPRGGVTGYVATRADASGASAYAVTDAGVLFALDDALVPVWSLTLSGAALLQPVLAPPGPAPGALPTLWVPDAQGQLHAVAVDAD